MQRFFRFFFLFRQQKNKWQTHQVSAIDGYDTVFRCCLFACTDRWLLFLRNISQCFLEQLPEGFHGADECAFGRGVR